MKQDKESKPDLEIVKMAEELFLARVTQRIAADEIKQLKEQLISSPNFMFGKFKFQNDTFKMSFIETMRTKVRMGILRQSVDPVLIKKAEQSYPTKDLDIKPLCGWPEYIKNYNKFR